MPGANFQNYPFAAALKAELASVENVVDFDVRLLDPVIREQTLSSQLYETLTAEVRSGSGVRPTVPPQLTLKRVTDFLAALSLRPAAGTGLARLLNREMASLGLSRPRRGRPAGSFRPLVYGRYVELVERGIHQARLIERRGELRSTLGDGWRSKFLKSLLRDGWPEDSVYLIVSSTTERQIAKKIVASELGVEFDRIDRATRASNPRKNPRF